MSKVPGYTSLAYPLYLPIAPMTVITTATYNTRRLGFKSCENSFFLASTILGGHDVIKEFVATEVWPLSEGWKLSEIISLDVDWASQKVPFPRFNLRLKDGQSLEDFILEVKEKVNEMIVESTLNEYKAYRSPVKRKRRVNRVFSELGAETAFRSRPPSVDKKIPAVAVAVCSAAPPKAPRRRSSKKEKAKSNGGDTSSPAIRPGKTKSLESSKRKRKASEDVSNAEIQAASSLAHLGRKKFKKDVAAVV
jgi:hypothetical protein